MLLSSHLLRTLCSDLLGLVVDDQALHHMIDVTSAPNLGAKIGKLPEDLREPLQRCAQAVSDTSLPAFLEGLEEAAEAGDFLVKQLSKKAEVYVSTH